MHRAHSFALCFYALHSFISCIHFSFFTYQLCICYICSYIVICIAIIYASQLFTRCTYLSITLIHASLLIIHCTYLYFALIYVLHLFICCTHFMYQTHSMMRRTYSCNVFIHILLYLCIILHLSFHISTM